jgi:hypothetical protein
LVALRLLGILAGVLVERRSAAVVDAQRPLIAVARDARGIERIDAGLKRRRPLLPR